MTSVRKLVERLADAANDPATLTGTSVILRQASRLLTEQAAEIERLREALKALDVEPCLKRVFEFDGTKWILRADLSDMPVSIKTGERYVFYEGGKE